MSSSLASVVDTFLFFSISFYNSGIDWVQLAFGDLCVKLIVALIIKNLSDRQISIEKKLVNFIVKRIDRSYGKIFDFIYKIDEISLKKKKPIDLKIIKEALGE